MGDDLVPDEFEVPGFQAGGFVGGAGLEDDKGELVRNGLDSEGNIVRADMEAQGVVNYYFPVEIVVVGGLPEEEKAALEARIWENLGDALDRVT